MNVENFDTADLFDVMSLSFDPSLREFSILRVLPVGIYVDAGDDSSELGSQIATLVGEVLQEAGFEAPRTFGEYYGSYLVLNLCQSTVPLSGTEFEDKLSAIKHQLIERLKALPWSQVAATGAKSNSVLTIAVAVGEIALLVTIVPTVAPVIGAYAIPLKLWMYLKVAKEGATAINAFAEFVKGRQVNIAFVQTQAPKKQLPKSGKWDLDI